MFVFARFLCRVFGTRPELEPSSLSHGLDSSSLAELEDCKTACSFIFSKCCVSRCFLSRLAFLLFAVLDSFEASAISTAWSHTTATPIFSLRSQKFPVLLDFNQI